MDNLDLLLADMETFNTLPLGNKMNTGRKIEIELEADDTLENKVNDLTDKLMNAFGEKCELKSTDLNEEEELGMVGQFLIMIYKHTAQACAPSASWVSRTVLSWPAPPPTTQIASTAPIVEKGTNISITMNQVILVL